MPGPVFVRPAALRPADAVAVVAPAGPFDRPSFEAGLAVLAARYRVRVGEGIFARARYLAGDDGRRLDELAAALADDEVRAVFAARGGYGAMRLLARLAPKLAGLRPRAVVGFSDITALHGALQAAGWVSIHGPVVTQLGGQPPEVAERLFRLLESPAEPAPPLTGVPLVARRRRGAARRRQPLGPHATARDAAPAAARRRGAPARGRRRAPYRLDRMWTHLALAGVFERVRGLGAGGVHRLRGAGRRPRLGRGPRASWRRRRGCPASARLPIGHGAVNQPVPLGVRVRLDAGAGEARVPGAGGRAVSARLQAMLDEAAAGGTFPCARAVVRWRGRTVFSGGRGRPDASSTSRRSPSRWPPPPSSCPCGPKASSAPDTALGRAFPESPLGRGRGDRGRPPGAPQRPAGVRAVLRARPRRRAAAARRRLPAGGAHRRPARRRGGGRCATPPVGPRADAGALQRRGLHRARRAAGRRRRRARSTPCSPSAWPRRSGSPPGSGGCRSRVAPAGPEVAPTGTRAAPRAGARARKGCGRDLPERPRAPRRGGRRQRLGDGRGRRPRGALRHRGRRGPLRPGGARRAGRRRPDRAAGALGGRAPARHRDARQHARARASTRASRRCRAVVGRPPPRHGAARRGRPPRLHRHQPLDRPRPRAGRGALHQPDGARPRGDADPRVPPAVPRRRGGGVPAG